MRNARENCKAKHRGKKLRKMIINFPIQRLIIFSHYISLSDYVIPLDSITLRYTQASFPNILADISIFKPEYITTVDIEKKKHTAPSEKMPATSIAQR
jgi:hypothetical protein